MGHREDLVRRRLTQEERKRQEKARMKVQTDATKLTELNQQYDKLIAAFDTEGKRIARLLEDVDWSQAVLKTFVYTKSHWWSRRRTVELACYNFAPYLDGYRGWMSSDDVLYLADGDGRLQRPSKQFARPTTGSHTVSRMQSVLRALREYEATVAS